LGLFLLNSGIPIGIHDRLLDTRLSELLDHQQAGILVEGDRLELQTLMQIYQEGLFRKATALSEAVKRGLMEPLS
jgi:hypothetical protein